MRIKDSKGLHYLRELMRTPGLDVHVCDLASVTADSRQSRAVMTGDAGPVLDQRAKDDYRRRIAALREELDDAEQANDIGRSERARAEIEQLSDHLAVAFGLGGRDRRAVDTVERTRLNVTRAIRAVIGKVAIGHPQLARHLDASVITGRLCRYRLPGRDPVSWRF